MTLIHLARRFGNRPDDAHDKGLIGILYAVEKTFVRMTEGTVLFLWHTVPDFWRELVVRLRSILRFAARLTVRLVRAGAAILVWHAIVFGPLLLFTGVLSILWMAIALVGSVWGLRRSMKNRAGAGDTSIALEGSEGIVPAVAEVR